MPTINGKEAFRLHEAFVAGDLEAVRSALGESSEFLNSRLPAALGGGSPLGYAIDHGPVELIRALLELGADVDSEEDGFPSLIAAILSERDDIPEILALLLSAGADVNQRGAGDYTALHYAVGQNNAEAVKLLVAHGAYLTPRIRIDDYETPLEGIKEDNEAARVLREAIESARLSRRRDHHWVAPPEIAKLFQEVDIAFEDWPFPGEDEIAPRDSAEWRFFRGRKWQDVTLESVLEASGVDWSTFLFAMKPPGFAYYLPAFLKLALDLDGPVDITDPVLFGLAIWMGEGLVPLLGPRQKLVVVRILEHLASEFRKRGWKTNPAQEALDRRWGHFTNEELGLKPHVQE